MEQHQRCAVHGSCRFIGWRRGRYNHVLPIEASVGHIGGLRQCGKRRCQLDSWPGRRWQKPRVRYPSLTINGTDLTVLSGGIDGLPAGLFLRLGPNGHEIPGLRGSLSDCSEANETNCDRIDFSRSDSLTLGLAICLCEGQARDLGKGMLGLDCYFGRGGTYMNYTIGYGPMAADTVTLFVDDPELATRHKICLGTPLAHRFPQLLVREGDRKPGVVFDGVETAMRPSLIAAQVDEDYADDLASATILRQLAGLND